jgi:hypothetical protein
MKMTTERWQKVRSIVKQALEREPAERPALLDELCGDDPALCQEVESVLAADADASGFLEPSASGRRIERFPGSGSAQPPSTRLGATYT